MKKVTALLMATTSIMFPMVAFAEGLDSKISSTTNASDISEIIVTAQKRSERLRDVPISINAVSSEQLSRQNITSPSDLEKLVPGFSYEKSSYGPPVFSIRGIGVYDTFVGMSPTVTVYTDQVPLPFLAMSQGASLDLERVEVLKGPQGTLFGQNATGGAVNYIAAKPTRTLKMGADFTYGRFNELDGQGFVSGPLTDSLSARLVVRHEARDGWQDSLSRPGDTLGKRDFTVGRLLLDWNVADRLKLELNANGWLDKSDTQAAQFIQFAPAVPNGVPISLPLANHAVAPNNPRAADWLAGVPLRHDDAMGQVSLRGDYAFDDVTLTSITSFAHFKGNSTIDTDGTEGIEVTPGVNVPNFLMNPVAKIDTITQEIRVAGKQGPVKYTFGGNYQNDTIDYVESLSYNGSSSGASFPWGTFFSNKLRNINYQHVETVSGFANLDYEVLRGLTLTGAVRYSYQWRRYHGCTADGGDGLMALAFYAPIPGNTMAGPGQCVTWTSNANPMRLADGVNSNLNQGNVSWRAGINWKPDAATLIYGNVTKGYKAGSYTPLPAVVAQQLDPVTQESVTAYEIGVKTGFVGNHVLLSLAGFHYDYSDKQILSYKLIPPFGPLPALINIPKGRINGFEAELTVHPAKGLRITSGLSYVDTKVRGSAPGYDPYGKAIDFGGEAFPNAPKWQFVGDVQYDFALTSRLKAYAGASVSTRSATWAAFGQDPAFRIDGYTLLGLRAGVETLDGHWRAQVFGNNVGNTFYVINVSHLTDVVARTTGMPATYGFTLSYRY